MQQWGAISKREVAISKLRSTKKPRESGDNEVDAVSNCLGEVAVGAELLAEANEDKGLDQLVEVSFHRVPSVAEESVVLLA